MRFCKNITFLFFRFFYSLYTEYIKCDEVSIYLYYFYFDNTTIIRSCLCHKHSIMHHHIFLNVRIKINSMNKKELMMMILEYYTSDACVLRSVKKKRDVQLKYYMNVFLKGRITFFFYFGQKIVFMARMEKSK